MKTVEMQIYKLNELPENVQEEIINCWRNDDEYYWQSENTESLNKFADLFNIKIKNYEYGYHNFINYSLNVEEEIENMNYLRLHKWIVNNYYDHIYTKKTYNNYYVNSDKVINKVIKRTSQLIREKYNCPLTGYFMDNDILDPLYKFIEKPYDTDYEDLMNECLNSWLSACNRDYEDWLSEERIREEIECNDYDFTIDGKLY